MHLTKLWTLANQSNAKNAVKLIPTSEATTWVLKCSFFFFIQCYKWNQWNTKITRRIAIVITLFGYLTRVTPVCRCIQPFCGCRHLATSRESKAHFGLPWVRPWDNRGKCYMDQKRIQCLSNAIYLQQFPSNSTRNLAHFLHILASPGYAPETIAVNVTWIKREFNACQTPRSMYPWLSSTVSQ